MSELPFLGESGRVNRFTFRKYSGVIGDARSVIELVGDMIQSSDAKHTSAPQG